MSSHSNDNRDEPGARSVDVRTCKECDVFGEDRCSMHGKMVSGGASDHGYTRLRSKYAGSCRVCRRPFEKDQIIYWAPERKPMCEPCGQGNDGAEASLPDADRARMMQLMDVMAIIEQYEKPWNDAIQDQFETTLAALYGQFRTVARVSAYLERHMEELRSIPARRGMQHSRPLISKRADACRICHKTTEKGELIWWSPSEPLMCFDCGRGKDPIESDLPEEDRKRVDALLARAAEFDGMSRPWTPEQICEYDVLLVSLYSRYRAIGRVKRVLLKHIDSLKDIAERKGPGEKRTVLAKAADSCKSCSRTIDKGDVVWWSPDEHRLCFDCGQVEQGEGAPDGADHIRARSLLERLVELDSQHVATLPVAWAAKLLDEREDVLIELYCEFRHIDEVRKRLYENFTELCAIAGKAQ